ncbi:hypothetical protein SEA_ALEEMILY_59 [Gordonia phage Aleemily]|uniref:Uncharacterized protein n=1 Tax=Gordonia phage Aleemily TaxID=2965181 RepID=A0A9E7TYC8_9CAUD|nr:hypothetical protein SEA_ALEEMILY_59 [Gordonia phage Aleemily]
MIGGNERIDHLIGRYAGLDDEHALAQTHERLGQWIDSSIALSDRMSDLMSDAMIVAFYRHFGTIPTDEQFTHEQLDWIEGFETARLADMRDHDLWVSGKARESRLVGHLARWLSENAPGVRHILGGW